VCGELLPFSDFKTHTTEREKEQSAAAAAAAAAAEVRRYQREYPRLFRERVCGFAGEAGQTIR
jgi:hypothetical protein